MIADYSEVYGIAYDFKGHPVMDVNPCLPESRIRGTSYLIPTPLFSATLLVSAKVEFHFISSIFFRFPPFTSQHHSSSDLPISPFASFSVTPAYLPAESSAPASAGFPYQSI
jgi:hypothetical protein